MVPGDSAGLAAEEGGRNALYVRVDIGSLEVDPPLPEAPQTPFCITSGRACAERRQC